ncbi:MAG: hypothetical protein ABI680_18620, partial [Chthoniobacteraceae bacterium]
GIAEFRAFDPNFAVQTNANRGGGNILLGVISETMPGASIVFQSSDPYFNEVRGVSTYTGRTDVQSGTLRVAIGGSIAGSSEIHLAEFSTLDVSDSFSGYDIPANQLFTGDGSIQGKLNFSGTLAPGTQGIGTLTGVDLLLNGGASLDFELRTLDSTSDHLSLFFSFAKGSDGPFQFDFQNGGLNGETYSLVDFSSTTFAASDFSFVNLAPGVSGSFQITGNELLFVTIPEPNSALLAISAFGGILGWPRRRRRNC